MTYVIVTEKQTTVGTPYASYMEAMDAASKLFGDAVADWVKLNLRVEENR